jgi:glycerate-2-kinase
MIIQNFQDLVSNSKSATESFARKVMLDILDFGVKSVLPQNLVTKSIKLTDESLFIQDFKVNLSQINNVYVVGAGKASGAMAEALEQILSSKITAGSVNIPEGTKSRYNTQIIHLNEATHPIPSELGVSGAQEIVEIVKQAKENDLIIVLLSGGGSALLTLPVNSIPLEEFNILNKLLLRSGATIQEINTVRKHCSQIAGGQLAKYGYPATIVSLILSDVIDGSVDSIASGPTVPDPTTYSQAIQVLKKYHLWEITPSLIQNHLQSGKKGIIPETIKPNNKIFLKNQVIILGDVKLACESIKKFAIQKGLHSYMYSYHLIGEARNVAKKFLEDAKRIYYTKQKKPIILIAGGETTVTVKGEGMGGRCQEMGLAIISEFESLPNIIFAAMGTDGIDGFTDAAGIIIDNHSSILMKKKNLDPDKYLYNNDSYHFFQELGDSLIFTGPTGTNVNDLMLIGIF